MDEMRPEYDFTKGVRGKHAPTPFEALVGLILASDELVETVVADGSFQHAWNERDVRAAIRACLAIGMNALKREVSP
jgi:hypothetical protein